MSAPTVTVYTKPSCQQCDATTRLLDRRGVDYSTVNLAGNPDAVDLVRNLGFAQAPVVVTDTEAWAGFRPAKIEALARTGAAT